MKSGAACSDNYGCDNERKLSPGVCDDGASLNTADEIVLVKL